MKKNLPITDEDRSDCLNFREVLFTAGVCSTKLIELQGGAVYCRAMLHPDMSEWVEILWIQLQEKSSVSFVSSPSRMIHMGNHVHQL